MLAWALPLAAFPLFFARSDTWFLCGFFFFSLLQYFLFFRFFSSHSESFGVWAGILLRVWLVFTPVFLSEDTFRFLWDGLLVLDGVSPYSELPIHIEAYQNVYDGKELLTRMNSANYYSVYPPILQGLFIIPSFLLKQGVSILAAIGVWKGILLFFELGILYLFRKNENRTKTSYLKYWLHPLVLWEGLGNGHPEPILFFFLFLLFVYWEKQKFFRSAIFYLASILTKILPLLLAPFIFFWWCRRTKTKNILFTLLILFFLLGNIGVWLFTSEFGQNIFQEHWRKGIGVYFTLFEFHGGLYYLVRSLIRFTWYPYSTGIVLGILSFILISFYSFTTSARERKDELVFLFNVWIQLSGIYYLFSSTVHPWYFLPILGASVFTGSIWPGVASGVWILSYSTYSSLPYYDRTWVLILEYSLVLGAVFWETFLKKKVQIR
ncbi:hypothetical protein [Leptospira sarikeiensis]|uniref:hypothetical protein n=1 Tax=Leptospira sarikeiensis TaxID=2484943 RepID=UPI001FE561FD|nr:hypothetical protein [Leptospira sarikeiensis]